MWKPVISKNVVDWMKAHLEPWQRDQLDAMTRQLVEVHDQERGPAADLDRERLSTDLDRLAGEDPDVARGRPGATPALTWIDETRVWSSPRGYGKTAQARRSMDAWIAAFELATGRKPDVTTVGRDKPKPLEHLVPDYADGVDRQPAGGGEPMTTWSSAPRWTDDDQVGRELQWEYDEVDRRHSRRYHEGTWEPYRQDPDDPKLKPYLDVMDASAERLARESGIPAEFLRFRL